MQGLEFHSRSGWQMVHVTDSTELPSCKPRRKGRRQGREVDDLRDGEDVISEVRTAESLMYRREYNA